MSFLNFLRQNWPELLTLLRQHVWLVFISILIAVAIGIPSGILLTRKQSLRGPVLGVANVMQTIPSLALFGFLIPLKIVGGIGARTAIVALVLYSLLPIIRNTVTGILGVDPNVREAAVAMGMTGRQVLWQVELPLAMSVIVTGVRVAMVIAIGVATIADHHHSAPETTLTVTLNQFAECVGIAILCRCHKHLLAGFTGSIPGRRGFVRRCLVLPLVVIRMKD